MSKRDFEETPTPPVVVDTSNLSPEYRHYRKLILTDLHRNRGVPAQDHVALHNPDLSADEWHGSAAERKALVPKVKALHEHLAANPQVYKHTKKRVI